MKRYLKVIIISILFVYLNACTQSADKTGCTSQNKDPKKTDEFRCCYLTITTMGVPVYNCVWAPYQIDALKQFIAPYKVSSLVDVTIDCSSTYLLVAPVLLFLGFIF